MATFAVDEVEKETKPLPATASLEQIVQSCIGGVKPEAIYSRPSGPYGTTYAPVNNGFVSAVHIAYSSHYPLIISPDAIWQCIAQGLAQHINANAEKLRKLFVEHEGKKEIIVQRDDFVKGSPYNPWQEVFGEFSEQIRRHVGEKTHDLLTPAFSTTGSVEKAAAQVVLMDCFKEYFSYTLTSRCGIPEITLEGTVDDWKTLRDRAVGLAQYDLDWWISALTPILNQFVAAASGNVDTSFWSALYKENKRSGGPFISGWILTLFPYTASGHRNRYGCFTTKSFTPGIVSTPFMWDYLDENYPMYFYAGFMAVTQDLSTLAVRPEIGWAVADGKVVESIKEQREAQQARWF